MNELAIDTRERRSVDPKDHRDRRLIDVNNGQSLWVFYRSYRFTDLDVIKSRKSDDLAGYQPATELIASCSSKRSPPVTGYHLQDHSRTSVRYNDP